jgi:hypothetical protein
LQLQAKKESKKRQKKVAASDIMIFNNIEGLTY